MVFDTILVHYFEHCVEKPKMSELHVVALTSLRECTTFTCFRPVAILNFLMLYNCSEHNNRNLPLIMHNCLQVRIRTKLSSVQNLNIGLMIYILEVSSYNRIFFSHAILIDWWICSHLWQVVHSVLKVLTSSGLEHVVFSNDARWIITTIRRVPNCCSMNTVNYDRVPKSIFVCRSFVRIITIELC